MFRVDFTGAHGWFGGSWVRCLRIASVARGQSPVPSSSTLEIVRRGLALFQFLTLILYAGFLVSRNVKGELGARSGSSCDFAFLGVALGQLLVHQGPTSHRAFLCCSSEHHAILHRHFLVCLGAMWTFGAWGPSYVECSAWVLNSVTAAALWLPLWCLVALWSVLCQQAFPRRSACGFLVAGPGVLVDTTCVLSVGSIGVISGQGSFHC